MARANKVGTDRAAWFAKEEFNAGLVAAGSGPGRKVAGKKVAARYDVKGVANATAIIRYSGPVHLLYAQTKPHFIGAKLLGTRNGLRARSVGVGVQNAFGGSNRGAFGQMAINVGYNRWGSYRQQASSGRGLRRRKGKKALVFGGSKGPKAYAFHPGTKGRNAWPIVKNRVERGAPEVWALAHRNALLDAFRCGCRGALLR